MILLVTSAISIFDRRSTRFKIVSNSREKYMCPSDLVDSLVREHFYVEFFCLKTGLRLESLELCRENRVPELTYFFNDNLGGYNLNGILKSLDDYLSLLPVND